MMPSLTLPPDAIRGSRSRDFAFRVALNVGLVLFTVYHLFIVVSYYQAFRLYTHDVGLEAYLMYHTWHGRFFWSIVHDCSFFAKHFTPTLLLLTPLHAAFPQALTMPVLECLALSSGAWGVAWLFDGLLWRGRKRGGGLSALGLLLGWCFAASPYTGSILLAFHFESFGVALSIWALAGLVNRRWWLFWALLVLALGVKEDLALYWAVFGVWWIVFRDRVSGKAAAESGLAALRFASPGWRVGAGVLVLGLVWAGVALLTIRGVAQAAGEPLAEFSARYDWLGAELPGRLKTVLGDGRLWFGPLWKTGGLLLWSVFFLALLAPETLLLLIPGAYVMGLSNVGPQHDLLYYYCYPFLPFLYLGAALGLARLVRWRRAAAFRRRLRKAVAWALLLGGCWLAYLPTFTDHLRRLPLRGTARQEWVRKTLREQIPLGASVAAQFDLLCQLPLRRGMFPLSERNVERAEYWALDLKGFRGDVDAAATRRILRRAEELVAGGRARRLVDSDGLIIVRRVMDGL